MGWLNTSNMSVRNSRLKRSVIFVSLVIEKSVFTKSGPRRALRPRVPGWQVPGTMGYVEPPGVVGVLLKVQGTARVAFGVDPQAGMAGAPPDGVPLKGSHRTALLNQFDGLPVV